MSGREPVPSLPDVDARSTRSLGATPPRSRSRASMWAGSDVAL